MGRRSVQSLSAVELYLYSPYGPSTCTEPQCSRAIPLLPLWTVQPIQSLSAVELYLYSPYGPYGLYRASVPVQGCPLRAGRPGDRILVKARFSAPVQIDLGAHPTSCTMDTEPFPGVKSGRGVTLTRHLLFVPWS
jgi:hypothetical protein